MTTTAGYWSKALAARISRRRGLAATAGMALGSALMLACGGGKSASDSQTSDLTTARDTTRDAKPGGVLKLSRTNDIPGFDPHNFAAPFAALNEIIYSRLLNIKPGHLKPADGEVEGDLAESWEFSPDKLQVTLKLRRNAAFHNIAPVNGRMADADDVAFSWKRMTEIGISRASVANSVNPNAPVLSITAVDPSTVVVKLKEPIVYILDLLTRRQVLGIAPKEAGGQFELKGRPIGTGAVYMSNYEPSIGLTLKRHEAYYDSQKAFVDQVDMPIVPEYATGLSQFRAGNIYWYDSLRGEDVLPTKKDIPDLFLYQDDVTADGWRTLFGQLPGPDGNKSPFLDERVRQAFSMSYDRDLWIEVVFAVKNFEAQGLPVETRWNTALVANVFEGWWLNPKSKDFGPNAKYFDHNIDEAKKLLTAAGYSNGIQQTSYIASSGFGPDTVKNLEVLEGFAGEAGFQIKPTLIDYNREYVPNIRDSEGQFSGIGYKSGPAASASEASARLIYDYHSKSAVSRYGYDVKGVGDNSGDPMVDKMLDDAKGEFDDKKRMSIVYDLQRYLAKKQYAVRSPGGASAFTLAWPAVQNYGVFRSDQPTRLMVKNWWLDQMKRPIGS